MLTWLEILSIVYDLRNSNYSMHLSSWTQAHFFIILNNEDKQGEAQRVVVWGEAKGHWALLAR